MSRNKNFGLGENSGLKMGNFSWSTELPGKYYKKPAKKNKFCQKKKCCRHPLLDDSEKNKTDGKQGRRKPQRGAGDVILLRDHPEALIPVGVRRGLRDGGGPSQRDGQGAGQVLPLDRLDDVAFQHPAARGPQIGVCVGGHGKVGSTRLHDPALGLVAQGALGDLGFF